MLLKAFSLFSIILVSGGTIMPDIIHELQQLHSSKNYYQDDVDLSHQYKAIQNNFASEAGPDDYDLSPVKPVHFRSIQYAPLIRVGELRLQNSMYSKIPQYQSPLGHTEKDLTYTTKKEKKPLEPRIDEHTEGPASISTHLEYIPGRNVEVLGSVNRSPGHNAVYRKYGSNVLKDDRKKGNILRQYIIYPNQREPEHMLDRFKQHSRAVHVTSKKITNMSTRTTTRRTTPTGPSELAAYTQNNKYYLTDPQKYVKEKLQKFPIPKMHSIYLNVARGSSSYKSPLLTGTKQSRLRDQITAPRPVIRVIGATQIKRSPKIDPKTNLNRLSAVPRYPIY